MNPSSPPDARTTVDPGQRRASGPAPQGQPAPLDSGIQDALDAKSPADAPLHAPDGQQPRQAAPASTPTPTPDGPLESLGKAISSPIRGAAEDDEGTPPAPPNPSVRP